MKRFANGVAVAYLKVYPWTTEEIYEAEIRTFFLPNVRFIIAGATYFAFAIITIIRPHILYFIDKLISFAHRPHDGDSKDLWNVGKLLPDYTALQPRRQPSSYSTPCENLKSEKLFCHGV
jgi:hypothetical protein